MTSNRYLLFGRWAVCFR